MSLHASAIEELLPHRYPFLFIDRIITLEDQDNRRIQCGYRIPGDHPYLDRQRTPAVFPPTLIVEALGQAAAVSIRSGHIPTPRKSHARGYLVRIDECSFQRPAHGGDELILASSLIASYGPLNKFEVQATVRDQVALIAALTLFVEV